VKSVKELSICLTFQIGIKHILNSPKRDEYMRNSPKRIEYMCVPVRILGGKHSVELILVFSVFFRRRNMISLLMLMM
jgi:hypothetical protein